MPEKNKGGRPRKDIEGAIVRMAKIGLTELQMAMVLDIDADEVFNFQELIDKNLPKNYMERRWRRLAKFSPELSAEYTKIYYKWGSETPAIRVKRAIWSQLYIRLHKKKGVKSKDAVAKLDYTFQELADHLESKFKDGMSWDNYGTWWVIDHIVPQSFFTIESANDESFLECWGIKNLQPMKKDDNLRKSNKWAG